MNIFLYLYVIICHILSIYNIKVTFWNKVQGGIIAVNGVISNSKVYPVQTISNLKGIGRDNTSAEHKSGEKPHSQTMNMKIAFEAYNNAPADCYTVTYNNKSQLQSFYYCPHHEYTYW